MYPFIQEHRISSTSVSGINKGLQSQTEVAGWPWKAWSSLLWVHHPFVYLCLLASGFAYCCDGLLGTLNSSKKLYSR